jgi:hypothetical protein
MIKFVTMEQRNANLLDAYGRLAKAFRWPTQVVPAFVRRTNRVKEEALESQRTGGKRQRSQLTPPGCDDASG